jgi:hypothetical protein
VHVIAAIADTLRELTEKGVGPGGIGSMGGGGGGGGGLPWYKSWFWVRNCISLRLLHFTVFVPIC